MGSHYWKNIQACWTRRKSTKERAFCHNPQGIQKTKSGRARNPEEEEETKRQGTGDVLVATDIGECVPSGDSQRRWAGRSHFQNLPLRIFLHKTCCPPLPEPLPPAQSVTACALLSARNPSLSQSLQRNLTQHTSSLLRRALLFWRLVLTVPSTAR